MIDHKRRILVVDDEQRVREAVKRVLSEAGYQVFLAEDGRQGLELVAEHSPDLVLVDLMMPVMDGMEFLDQARRSYPDLTSVVITGFATLEKAVEAMKQGADDFLAKPFKPRDLKMVVERALRRAATLQDISIEKSRNRALITAMANGVMVVNTECKIVLANPVLCHIIGLDEAEVMGRPCWEVLPWNQVCDCLENVLQEDQPPPERATSQVSLGSGDDATYWQASCAPFHDARGDVMGVVAVFNEVTAWHRLNQYKSEFVSTVAHDIASPLAAVQGQLQNLEQELLGPLAQKQKDLVGRARERLQAIADLSKDLLDLSKIEAGAMGEPGPVELGPLLEEALDLLKPKAVQKDQDLELELCEPLPPVKGVAQELMEVVVNLVSNAVKYTPQGGSVRVRAEQQDSEVLLSVKDNGLGIAPEEQEKIFNRFYRIKNADTRTIVGTGLGLAIVKRVLESHGGRVELTSAPGQGSTFMVYLPQA